MARRKYGTGSLYEKCGAYYGRWRTSDGRQVNRKVGAVRPAGTSEGLTRAQAERQLRRLQEEEERRPTPAKRAERHTVDDAADSLRRKLALEGGRKSYLENCQSMQRVHITPRLGSMPLEKVTTARVEALGAAMLDGGLSPKTTLNVLTFLFSVFEHGEKRGWVRDNPVRDAARPKRRRATDANPDLQFLTVVELEAVLRAIPDEVVHRAPRASRAGRRGPVCGSRPLIRGRTNRSKVGFRPEASGTGPCERLSRRS